MAFGIDLTLFTGVKGYRSALSRLNNAAYDSYAPALGTGMARCFNCQRPTRLHIDASRSYPARLGADGPLLFTACEHCRLQSNQVLTGLTFTLPAGQRFWREQSRIVAMPVRHVSAGGRPALLVGFASLSSAARLEALYDQQTLALIQIDATKG